MALFDNPHGEGQLTVAVLSLAVAVVALFSALVTNWGWGALLVGPALFVAGLVEGGFCLAFANKTAMRVMLAAALLSAVASAVGVSRAHGG